MSKHGGTSKGGGSKAVNKSAEAAEYQTFSDKPVTSFQYEIDGSKAEKFFQNNSNFNKLIESMTTDEREAFLAWARGSFMGGDIYSGGFDALSFSLQEYQRSLDKTIDQATLSKGVQVVRLSDAQLVLGKGKISPTLEQLQAMKGRIVNSAGNMSAAAASEGLAIGGIVGSPWKNIEYKLKIPKGSTGAGMWIGDKRINGWSSLQREFLINRDTNWKVGNTTYNKSRKVFEVELIYDSRNAHDYGKAGR